MCPSALKSFTWLGHFLTFWKRDEQHDRKITDTEQVITEAELRTMLEDEDDDSFADLISKGVAQARAALGVASRTAIGASGGTQTGHHPMKTTRDMRSCSS